MTTPSDNASFLPEDLSAEELDRLYLQAIDAVDAVVAQMDLPPFEAEQEQPTEPRPAAEAPKLTIDNLDAANSASATNAPRISAKQVIEAAVFVGGAPLTIKRLCGLFRGEFESDYVASAIDELNSQYLREQRPYEIHLGEGGYRMVLRQEFEPVRNRVYGLGPKEVKLSQEALEVLALVAYQQPVTRKEVEEAGKASAGSVLRQLLLRELISLERSEDDGEVRYRTTDRFLDLFGIGKLADLPRAEELSFK